ncbi:hypothetical protein NDA17_002707 [Ustilago hordei]|nr:hypothetical protein NDA17_002707 [Ustilago hordei]
MASFKSLLLGLMLALMAAYNASCYILENEAVIWRAGETLEEGVQRLKGMVLEVTNDGKAVSSESPDLFFHELNSVGRLDVGQNTLQGRDWNSWINAYITEQRQRLLRGQQNTARSDRPSG